MLSKTIGDAEMRALEPWLAAEFAAFAEEVRPDLVNWLPWADLVRDEESARAFLQGYADGTAADGRRIYGLWVDGTMVGGALFRIFDPRHQMCEIGAWLAPSARGRGLMTRTVQAMVDWAIDVRGVRRIEWRCVPENAASKAVAQRLGFRLEGTLRESFRHLDRSWDTEVWALLASERTAEGSKPGTQGPV